MTKTEKGGEGVHANSGITIRKDYVQVFIFCLVLLKMVFWYFLKWLLLGRQNHIAAKISTSTIKTFCDTRTGKRKKFFFFFFFFDALELNTNINYKKMHPLPLNTGRKLNVFKMLRRRPGLLLNDLCTFNLRIVPRVLGILCNLRYLSTNIHPDKTF